MPSGCERTPLSTDCRGRVPGAGATAHRREMRPAAALAVLVLASAALLSGAGNAEASSRWAPPLPLPLRVLRPFEPPSTPYGPGHRGVDLGAPPGTAIRSPASGVVRFAGPVAGEGVVTVDVQGMRFTYEPVVPRVHAGQRVALGAVLATLTGSSLHWGVRSGTRYLDPMRFARERIRLLPLDDGTTRLAAEFSPAGVTGPVAALALGAGVLATSARRRRRP